MMAPQLSCVARNIQRGRDRFFGTDPRELPRLRQWRCNLTTLSHVYNLYFVACNEVIYIYQPDFPEQVLPNAVLELHPPVHESTSASSNGIDPQFPHSVTRIHLDFLGNEEILLISCDDGNVIGYRTSHIQDAVCQADLKDANSIFKELTLEVHPFLLENVGASAWGLAVHREARMIAISANTHKVRIIAYALAQQETPWSRSLDGPEETPEDRAIRAIELLKEPDFPHVRQRDHIVILQTNHNIPAVSFDNTGADPEGRWLLTNSIDGTVHLWDIHSDAWSRSCRFGYEKPDEHIFSRPARVFKLGHCVSAEDSTRAPELDECQCTDAAQFPHAAWGTMFIDPIRCRNVETYEEAFGTLPLEDEPFFCHITLPKKIIETAQFYTHPQGTAGFCRDTYGLDFHLERYHFLPPNLQNLPMLEEHWNDPEAKKPYWDFDTVNELTRKPDSRGPNGPMVLINKTDVYLLQPQHEDTEYQSWPVIVMRSALFPHGTGQPDPPRSFDRLCYSAQIPELGIFLVGSPVGRVAIFSLTQMQWELKYCTVTPMLHPGIVYGFKREFVLPFSDQTPFYVDWAKYPEHNPRKLVGLTVAPIQGMQDPVDDKDEEEGSSPQLSQRLIECGRRRWRLMLLYEDHSVLSYELRRTGDDDEEVGVIAL